MPTKITKRTVDAIKANEADQFVWDADLKGFGLKVTTTGSKVYILQYRMGGRGAPTKRFTIGRHGALTPEQARKEAAGTILRASARQGRRPRPWPNYPTGFSPNMLPPRPSRAPRSNTVVSSKASSCQPLDARRYATRPGSSIQDARVG
jgi:hypothetical protein